MTRPALGRPVVVGTGPRLGRPVTVTGGTGPAVGDPVVVGGTEAGDPLRVGGWQQTEDPRPIPVGGGTRPVVEGDGPPPDFIPGIRVGDYYLDRLTGDLYRLGGPR